MTEIRTRGKERYGLALVLILASMIFVMAAPEADWSRTVTLALQGAALVASLRAAQIERPIRLVTIILVCMVLIVAAAFTLFDTDVGPLYVKWTSLILVILATPVITLGIVKQVKEKRQITIHTMMGVLCIYLLMGIAFASGFGLIEAVGDQPFFRAGDGADTLSNYLYFSLTTITTAGLGDFAPRSNLGRSLTGAEALIGQIYLVTIVAVIVANLGRKR